MRTQKIISNEIRTLCNNVNRYNEFHFLFSGNEIYETEKYYFKIVNMFGHKELRLHKKSLRVTTSKIKTKIL